MLYARASSLPRAVSYFPRKFTVARETTNGACRPPIPRSAEATDYSTGTCEKEFFPTRAVKGQERGRDTRGDDNTRAKSSNDAIGARYKPVKRHRNLHLRARLFISHGTYRAYDLVPVSHVPIIIATRNRNSNP